MPTLMGLPNEILTAIIEATEPDDIESFSTCCKLMYSLARHRLEEHKQKKSLYSTVSVSDYALLYPEPFQGEEFNTQLQGLFLDKRNRLYTKTMAVEFFAHFAAEMSAVNDLGGFEQQLESSMTEVHNKIGLDTGGIEANEWSKDVKGGNTSATLLLLLAFLPNLENVSIEFSTFWSLRLSAGYSKILSLMTKASLKQSKNELSFGGRLSKCTVHGDGFEALEEGILPFLMMLPRIQVFQGYGLSIEDSYSWPYADAVSPVVDLELHGEVEAFTLSGYLCGIRELKRFRYTHDGDHVLGRYIPFKPCEIIATLREFAFRSLVDLDFTIDASIQMSWSIDLPGIGSLRSFEVLETIRLQYILLFQEARVANSADIVNLAQTSEDLCDEPKIRGQKLIDFLPSSARTFRLEDIAERRLVLELFKGFPEHRVERLPKLEVISLHAGDQINTKIEKICRRSGVRWRSGKKISVFCGTSEG